MCFVKMEPITVEPLLNSTTCKESVVEGENVEKTTQNPPIDPTVASGVLGGEDKAANTTSDVNLNVDNLNKGDCENGNETEKGDEVTTLESCNAKPSATENSSSSAFEPTEGEVFVKIADGSLSNLLIYDSDDTTSDSSSDSDSFESVDTDIEQIEESTNNANKKKSINETVRTLGELSLDDLPPVPDISSLNIGVEEKDCIHVGVISAIVERLVMVESLPNMPAYDLDTLLFLENGKKPLGYVYDVMGPVSSPIYVIRFNTIEEIASKGITKGLPVYSAPKTEHTQYVFLKQLMQVKGSDASWMGDNEVPLEHADFSDDEEERKIRRDARKNSGETRKRNSVERHKDFEKDMNVKNLIDTRLHKIRDSFEPSAKRHASNNNEKRGFPFQPNCGPNFGFSQHNLNAANVPSFPPVFNMPFMQAFPFPNIPFMPNHNMPPMPHLPPLFRATLPPPPPPQMQSIPPPPPPIIGPQIPNMPLQMQTFPNMSMPPPMLPIGKGQGQPRMLFPPDMGLPRPPNAFVPHMSYYDPRVPRMWSYQNRPQNYRGPPNFVQPMRGNFFPKRP